MAEKSCNAGGGKEEEYDEKIKDRTKTERSADYVRQTLKNKRQNENRSFDVVGRP